MSSTFEKVSIAVSLLVLAIINFVVAYDIAYTASALAGNNLDLIVWSVYFYAIGCVGGKKKAFKKFTM